MKKPTPSYQQKQKRLAALTGISKKTREEQVERQKLEESLFEEFTQAFDLEPDKGRVTNRFFSRFENTDLGPRSHIFDHKDFFRRGENYVIVSQPYGIEKDELKRWCEECGASYTIASDWGYYYPGRADLFLVEFTPAAKVAFDKRLRQQR